MCFLKPWQCSCLVFVKFFEAKRAPLGFQTTGPTKAEYSLADSIFNTGNIGNPCYDNFIHEFSDKNKIEGTSILKFAMVKRLKVKKNLLKNQNSLKKFVQKILSKISVKKFREKSSAQSYK